MSIKKELSVEASQETAFQVFSQKMDLWWPRSHHVGATPLVKMVVEQANNGRWYSTHEDGSQCQIGYVQSYEPNTRLVLVWQLGADFKFDSKLITEVEVQFQKVGENRTLVKFEHRHMERMGRKAEGMDQGWGMILGLFAEVAAHGKLEGQMLAMYGQRSAR